MALKMQALQQRVAAGTLQVAAPVQAQLCGRLRHDRVRTTLPGPRWRRIAPLLAELGAGGYRRYGTGLRGALLDLLAPAGGTHAG